jgi:hypothetical protein
LFKLSSCSYPEGITLMWQAPHHGKKKHILSFVTNASFPIFLPKLKALDGWSVHRVGPENGCLAYMDEGKLFGLSETLNIEQIKK